MKNICTSPAFVQRRSFSKKWGVVFLCIVIPWFGFVEATLAETHVTVVKTPNGGFQPQAVVDAKNTIHLIYFKGKERAGNLFYVQRESGKEDFSHPIRVNSIAGSAVLIGTVRRGQIALGKDERVHVAWNGSPRVRNENGAPMLYTRMNDEGTEFEEQRNLIQETMHLDGGGTVTADDSGNVYVAWHAVKAGSKGEEQDRQIWIARSTDEGKSFTKEVPAWSKKTGSCSCCAMRGLTTSNGSTYMLYRAANDEYRDIYLLSSKGSSDRSFRGSLVHKWEIATCPMSTMAIAEGVNDVVISWETDGKIYFTKVKSGTIKFSRPKNASGFDKKCKHPALAVNDKGEMLLAWTEGTSWQEGGDLAWQMFDKEGKPSELKGEMVSAIPVWGLLTVVATDKGFTIFH